MICRICKSNIRDDAVFCPVCGKPVLQETTDTRNTDTLELSMNENDPLSSSVKPEEPHVPVPDQPEMSGHYDDFSRESHPASRNSFPSDQSENRTEKDPDSSYHREYSRRENAIPGQQGRARQQYRNVPPQGPASASFGAASRPDNRRNHQTAPVSEKEVFRLKNNLSKKAMVAFICSIFGIGAVAMNLPFSIVGLVFSIMVKNGYRDRGWQKDSDLKLANAAFVCSIIGIVLGVIGLIVIMATGAGIIAGLTSLASMSSGGSYYGY